MIASAGVDPCQGDQIIAGMPAQTTQPPGVQVGRPIARVAIDDVIADTTEGIERSNGAAMLRPHQT